MEKKTLNNNIPKMLANLGRAALCRRRESVKICTYIPAVYTQVIQMDRRLVVLMYNSRSGGEEEMLHA